MTDVNAAGGVFGQEMTLEGEDSGGSPEQAGVSVDRLLDGEVDVIIGPALSQVSLAVIDRITEAGVIQFSPANTHAAFSSYADGGLYFRTAPSDLLQGQVLAQMTFDSGNRSSSVIFADDLGEGPFAQSFQQRFDDLGGIVDQFLPYRLDQESLEAEVFALASAGSDVIVVIGGDESAQILVLMHDNGIGPTSTTDV